MDLRKLYESSNDGLLYRPYFIYTENGEGEAWDAKALANQFESWHDAGEFQDEDWDFFVECGKDPVKWWKAGGNDPKGFGMCNDFISDGIFAEFKRVAAKYNRDCCDKGYGNFANIGESPYYFDEFKAEGNKIIVTMRAPLKSLVNEYFDWGKENDLEYIDNDFSSMSLDLPPFEMDCEPGSNILTVTFDEDCLSTYL